MVGPLSQGIGHESSDAKAVHQRAQVLTGFRAEYTKREYILSCVQCQGKAFTVAAGKNGLMGVRKIAESGIRQDDIDQTRGQGFTAIEAIDRCIDKAGLGVHNGDRKQSVAGSSQPPLSSVGFQRFANGQAFFDAIGLDENLQILQGFQNFAAGAGCDVDTKVWRDMAGENSGGPLIDYFPYRSRIKVHRFSLAVAQKAVDGRLGGLFLGWKDEPLADQGISRQTDGFL